MKTEKSMIERLHLNRVLTSSDDYLKILDGMYTMDNSLLKNFFGVYKDFLTGVESLLKDNHNMNQDVLSEKNLAYQDLLLNPDIKNYLDGRYKQDYKLSMTSRWIETVDSLLEEVCFYGVEDLLSVYVRANILMCFLDGILLKKDVDWYPYSLYSVSLIKEAGFIFYKEKERIWQPKSGG